MKKIILTILLCNCFFTFAQKSKTLTKLETDELVNQICNNLEQNYFDSEKAKALNSIFKKKLKKSEFYNIPTDSLTKKLTLLLRNQTNDIHFYIGKSKPNIEKDPIKETPKQNFNGGFTEVKILENNIGYIKWDRCIANDEAFRKIKSALVFLEGVDKLIIDISENPGGDGRSGGFINYHLYEDQSYQSLLMKKCVGEENWYQSEVAYNYSDAPKFFEIPLYIITSNNTGSASEYFAFIAQEMQRATILGQTTAGAGNPVTMVSMGEYFMYVPVCEIVTYEGKSIEAKGVIPDVKLTSNDWLNETLNYINKK
ncbi:S41 family peptidase [Flavobacterium sediminilitoris]|uniref:S41 family peptidase n=1 Tax=Flavobacterium sediminilitoris TaxID=2024526 RepID=A0ABY4HKA9_9FLAO|nr:MULTISPECIES: S41 family peptidase [Flavobacterium]UOX33096.1 S41 family peptidase [Flavobacterium sediminilitoris]